jgi:hypothetical protein
MASKRARSILLGRILAMLLIAILLLPVVGGVAFCDGGDGDPPATPPIPPKPPEATSGEDLSLWDWFVGVIDTII